MNSAPPSPVPLDEKTPAEAPDWEDFRDHLATADQDGRRRWIYPRQPEGRYYQWRKSLSWLLLGILFTGPFIKIGGNPLLMMNIVTRRFSILGQIFWPQDMALLAIALLLFFVGIMVFTAAYGRLWCGWVCPQTLLMEMVFRRIEYKIEGNAREQRALNAAPWAAHKITVKLAKQLIFFGLSFVISNLLLSYIIGVDQLIKIITDNPAKHLSGLSYLLVFTGIFYAIFARFREQACTFICPYGRFQSTVLDENTVVVAYDHKRGEPRGFRDYAKGGEANHDSPHGDCVDCHLCHAVCPTGIDIRNGIQMECVNCTACIDACDSVMDKMGRARGLVRYASLNSIERGERFRVTPRMFGYATILGLLIALFLVVVLTRSNVEATLLRAPGALYQQLPNGNLINLYTVQLVNKTSKTIPIDLRLEGTPGKLSVMGNSSLVVRGEQLVDTSVLIELAPDLVKHGQKRLDVGVYSQGRHLQTVHTTFIGPRE